MSCLLATLIHSVCSPDGSGAKSITSFSGDPTSCSISINALAESLVDTIGVAQVCVPLVMIKAQVFAIKGLHFGVQVVSTPSPRELPPVQMQVVNSTPLGQWMQGQLDSLLSCHSESAFGSVNVDVETFGNC